MPIRFAHIDDAGAIAALYQLVWPDLSVDACQVQRAIEDPTHAPFVAIEDTHVIGFVDGFSTISVDNIPRWEVDLLAVHPDYRGRGVARALICANTQAGRERETRFARTLIRVGNIGSEKAFASCGYTRNETLCDLYVSTSFQPPYGLITQSETETYLVRVNTMGYRGVWLEGEVSTSSFALANSISQEQELDSAGAVIPQAQRVSIRAAQHADYAKIGEYYWWYLPF